VLVVALLSLYGLSGRTFNPWWLGSISFEQYVDLMRPWVDRIVGHRAHRHDVCLDAEDLRQDALLVLWTVHQRLADTSRQPTCAASERRPSSASSSRSITSVAESIGARSASRASGTDDAPGSPPSSASLSTASIPWNQPGTMQRKPA
jgi:hypothetical protein